MRCADRQERQTHGDGRGGACKAGRRGGPAVTPAPGQSKEMRQQSPAEAKGWAAGQVWRARPHMSGSRKQCGGLVAHLQGSAGFWFKAAARVRGPAGTGGEGGLCLPCLPSPSSVGLVPGQLAVAGELALQAGEGRAHAGASEQAHGVAVL